MTHSRTLSASRNRTVAEHPEGHCTRQHHEDRTDPRGLTENHTPISHPRTDAMRVDGDQKSIN